MFSKKSSQFYKRFINGICHSLFQKQRPASRRQGKTATYTYAQTEILEDRQLLAADDLTDLNDDFEDASTLANWQRIYQTEGWGADQLEVWDINNTQAGKMVFAPHTTVWYEDYRGPLVYKEISGDFVVTTQVQITDRDEIGDSDLDDVPSGSQFSLAGLMIRTPRNITDPALDWSEGSMQDDGTNDGENYVFLSLGWGNSGDEFQLETKSTRNSDSDLTLQSMGYNGVINLQIARIGETVYTLYQIPGEEWVLNSSEHRPDMPETLQVGMVAYTDWEKANDFDVFYHNSHTLQPGGDDPTPFNPFAPDLVAGFEFIQFDRPEIPEYLQGSDLGIMATNNQLLSFLGENVNNPILPDPATDTPMQIGMNLEGIADWSTAWTFTDMAHTMRTWSTESLNLDTYESEWNSPLFQMTLDENGWPTDSGVIVNELGETIVQRYISPILTGDVNPAGIYRAEWDGEATVWLPGIIEQGLTPEGRNYVLLDLPENYDISLIVSEINPANYFRDFNLWMPDYNGQSFAGQDWQPGDAFSPFHPLFLERLAPFETIRFMDWMETNGTDIVTWDDRPLLTDATYFGDGNPADFQNGMPVEYMIELSNTLGSNPWFNMPHMADDNFVQQFAEMVRDNLDPELKIYVEWSNEIWNFASGFSASYWIQDQLALPENAGMTWAEFAANEIQRDFEIWQDVFAGQEDRLVRVVAGQQATPSVLESLLANMDGNFDAVSVTAYAGLGVEQLEGFDEFTTADDVIDTILAESIPWSFARLVDHQNIADQYSALLGREIDLVTYEGGSHPDAFGWPAAAAVHEAALSPRMYDVYETLLNGADQIGVDLYNQYVFTGTGESAPWGDWGLLHDMDQPLEEAHEYQALVDFIDTHAAVPTVSIESPVAGVDELGSSTLEFTLTRSEDQLDQPLTVYYQVIGTATAGADFDNLTGEVTFLANETTATIVVNILEDLIDEDDESIEIQLLANPEYELDEVSLGTGWILDNDFTNVAPSAGVIFNQSIQEGNLFSLNVSSVFSDDNLIDGDQISLSAGLGGGAVLPSWLSFDAETGLLSGTPEVGDAGDYEITIVATDLAGLEAGSSFMLSVNPLLFTQYDVTIVSSPSTTSDNGEIADLPENLSYIHEWQTYWVEVWANVSNATDTGIETFYFNLNYNTAYTTATNIEYGAAFSEDQAGIIDDGSGNIQGISASTSLDDVGDDQFVLLVRIEFTPTSDDQININYDTHTIGPYQTGFEIDQPELQLTEQPDSQLESVNIAETEFWAVPYDANDDDIINFKDLVAFASAYGQSSLDVSHPYTWLMDFNQSGLVNFKDLVMFASNYGKSKLGNEELTFPDNFTDPWVAQNLAPNPSPEAPALVTMTAFTPPQAPQAFAGLNLLKDSKALETSPDSVAEITRNEMARALSEVNRERGTTHSDLQRQKPELFSDRSHSRTASDTSIKRDTAAARRVDFRFFNHPGQGDQTEVRSKRKATQATGTRRLATRPQMPQQDARDAELKELDHFFSSLSDTDLLAFG